MRVNPLVQNQSDVWGVVANFGGFRLVVRRFDSHDSMENASRKLARETVGDDPIRFHQSTSSRFVLQPNRIRPNRKLQIEVCSSVAIDDAGLCQMLGGATIGAHFEIGQFLSDWRKQSAIHLDDCQIVGWRRRCGGPDNLSGKRILGDTL